MRPYDLDTMGAPGAAVKAANAGNRYVWIISVDHADGGAKSHRDSFSFYIGFSSDPGIPPSVFTTIIQWNNTWLGDATTPGADGWTMGGDFGPTSFLYNPDDIDFPFYLYTQGFGNGFGLAYQTQSILWKSTNLFDWVGGAWGPRSLVGDPAIDYSVIQLTSHQTVTRHGTGDWTSLGIIGYLGWAGVGKWSSTDGKTWTADTTIYNITGFPSVNLTMDAGSGTPNRLTAASGIFSAPATGQTIGAIVYASTGHVTFTSAYWFTKIEYISSTQVDLVVQYSGIPTGPITFTNAAAPLEFGTVCYRKGPATSGGGVSGYGAFGALPSFSCWFSTLSMCY